MIEEQSEEKEQHTSEHYKGYDLQSMNLDATQRCSRQEKESECFQKKRNNSNVKKRRCYNCDIKEHYANECRKSKKSQQVAKMRKKLKQQQ